MLLTDHIGSTLAIILAIVVVPFKNNFVPRPRVPPQSQATQN
jgi:hypothetical protein